MQYWITAARRSNCVLDIGAYTGLYTLIAAATNESASIHSFEPNPSAYKRLAANILDNGFGERVILHEAAVTNSSGTASFHLPSNDLPTSGSLHDQGFRGFAGTKISVPKVRLDDAINRDVFPDLVKLDVEGFEIQALEGMERILTGRPSLIVECNPDGPIPELEKLLLAHYGYSSFHLTNKGLIPRQRILPDPTGRFKNYLFEHPGTVKNRI